MKRSPMKPGKPLERTTGLTRRSRLRARPKRQSAEANPAKLAWKTPTSGYCQCGNCWPQRWSLALQRHHIVPLERLKVIGRLDMAWDQRNALSIAEFCHGRHTSAFERIPISSVSAAAREFAVEVLGAGPAQVFFEIYYAPAQAVRRAA